jgi:hypothetical protein
MDPDLVDRIYESSFVPELWPGVLDELGRITGATGGSLFITQNNVQYWTASPENHERMKRFDLDRFWSGQTVARLFGARHAGFLTELDLFTPDELDREPLFRDMWRPLGIGYVVATALPIPTGEKVTFVLTRRTERGPMERAVVQKLDNLRPHLARSALMSARLQLERARIARFARQPGALLVCAARSLARNVRLAVRQTCLRRSLTIAPIALHARRHAVCHGSGRTTHRLECRLQS